MPLVRVIWFALGSAALVLAAIGVLLPLLPTTPFALLAVLAYGKSVPRFAASLERSRLLGPTLVNWRRNGAIAPRQKAVALAMMAGVFGVSVVLSLAVPILLVQAICLTGAAAFILSRPSGTGGQGAGKPGKGTRR